MPNPEVVAWFDMHGERDVAIASDREEPWHPVMSDAATYRARKLDLIDKVRAEIGTFFMCFGLFSDGLASLYPVVKMEFEAAITAAAAARPQCHVTQGAGLEDNSFIDPAQQPVHFSAAAQEEIAKNRFRALTGIIV
jgi:hypothetical protein